MDGHQNPAPMSDSAAAAALPPPPLPSLIAADLASSSSSAAHSNTLPPTSALPSQLDDLVNTTAPPTPSTSLGFFSKLRRSLTVGSYHDHRRNPLSADALSTNRNMSVNSTGVFARLRRSFTSSSSRHASNQSIASAAASDLVYDDQPHRNGGNLQSYGSGRGSTDRSNSRNRHRRSASIVAPFRKMRDSYVSCIMAVDSQLLDTGVAGCGSGGIGDLYSHHYFSNYASLSRRQSDNEDGGAQLYRTTSKVGGANGVADHLHFPTDAEIRIALQNSKQFKEAITE